MNYEIFLTNLLQHVIAIVAGMKRLFYLVLLNVKDTVLLHPVKCIVVGGLSSSGARFDTEINNKTKI